MTCTEGEPLEGVEAAKRLNALRGLETREECAEAAICVLSLLAETTLLQGENARAGSPERIKQLLLAAGDDAGNLGPVAASLLGREAGERCHAVFRDKVGLCSNKGSADNGGRCGNHGKVDKPLVWLTHALCNTGQLPAASFPSFAGGDDADSGNGKMECVACPMWDTLESAVRHGMTGENCLRGGEPGWTALADDRLVGTLVQFGRSVCAICAVERPIQAVLTSFLLSLERPGLYEDLSPFPPQGFLSVFGVSAEWVPAQDPEELAARVARGESMACLRVPEKFLGVFREAAPAPPPAVRQVSAPPGSASKLRALLRAGEEARGQRDPPAQRDGRAGGAKPNADGERLRLEEAFNREAATPHVALVRTPLEVAVAVGGRGRGGEWPQAPAEARARVEGAKLRGGLDGGGPSVPAPAGGGASPGDFDALRAEVTELRRAMTEEVEKRVTAAMASRQDHGAPELIPKRPRHAPPTDPFGREEGDRANYHGLKLLESEPYLGYSPTDDKAMGKQIASVLGEGCSSVRDVTHWGALLGSQRNQSVSFSVADGMLVGKAKVPLPPESEAVNRYWEGRVRQINEDHLGAEADARSPCHPSQPNAKVREYGLWQCKAVIVRYQLLRAVTTQLTSPERQWRFGFTQVWGFLNLNFIGGQGTYNWRSDPTDPGAEEHFYRYIARVDLRDLQALTPPHAVQQMAALYIGASSATLAEAARYEAKLAEALAGPGGQKARAGGAPVATDEEPLAKAAKDRLCKLCGIPNCPGYAAGAYKCTNPVKAACGTCGGNHAKYGERKWTCDEAKKAMAALAADPAPERQRKLTELFKLSAAVAANKKLHGYSA